MAPGEPPTHPHRTPKMSRQPGIMSMFKRQGKGTGPKPDPTPQPEPDARAAASDAQPPAAPAAGTGKPARLSTTSSQASADKPSPAQAKRKREGDADAAPSSTTPPEDPMAERRRELRESLRQKLAALEEKPAFLDVEQIAEKELPVALSHAKMLRKAADDPLAMTWKSGDSVPYFYLCDALAEVSTVSARLEVSTLMTRCFITLIEAAPAAVLPTVYLSLNKLAPAVEGIELGIGDAFLFKCIAAGGGLSEAQIREKYRQNGDLAEIAQHTKSKQTMLVAPKPLTLEQVYTTFKQVAQESGKDVQKRRMAWISKMMRSAKPIEANFIVRSLQGKMRLGLAEQTVLMSLAHAFLAVEVDIAPLSDAKVQWLLNSTADRLKQSFNEMPSFDRIIPELIKGGLCSLEKVTLTLNLPVKPMLAKPAKGVQLVLKRFSDGDFTCEYKYDGERAQIHCSRGKDGKRVVRIFSRNSENHTGKYPDVIQYFSDRPIIDGEVESFIIDSEVVAYDTVEKSIQPFQVLQHRARKEVKLEDVKVHVCIYAFDLLYLNGKSLLGETFTSRREKLHSSFAEIDGYFQFATGKDCTEEEDIETFLAESLKANCEGLMVKTLTRNSEYTPSRRTYNWLKLKKDYIDGAGDSVDLVPIGAWHGKGKRTGCYSAYLLACYDPESEGFQAICKVGTGFKDEDLTSLTTQLQDHTLSRPAPYYQVGSGDDPDVWFADTVVWEVKAADLSISPKHKAAIGIVDPAKGIALRFPRFIRTREDKSPQQATSSQQIAELYRSQFEGQEELQVADDDY